MSKVKAVRCENATEWTKVREALNKAVPINPFKDSRYNGVTLCIYLYSGGFDRLENAGKTISAQEFLKEGELDVGKEIDQEKLCEYCRDHYEESLNWHCEGIMCDDITEIYLEDNPQIITKEINMQKNISEVFDKTKDALLVEKYLGDRIGDDFLAGLVLADKKAEVLAEAKRLEKEDRASVTAIAKK